MKTSTDTLATGETTKSTAREPTSMLMDRSMKELGSGTKKMELVSTNTKMEMCFLEAGRMIGGTDSAR